MKSLSQFLFFIFLISTPGCDQLSSTDRHSGDTARASSLPASRDAKSDWSKFQGVWQVAAVEQGGHKKPVDPEEPSICDVEDDTFTLKNGTTVLQFKLRLIESEGPRQINATLLGERKARSHLDDKVFAEMEKKGFTIEAVYKFIADELVVCLPDQPTDPRPSDFSKDNHSIIIFKRKK